MPVEIVGRDVDGEKYRLNQFRSENELSRGRHSAAVTTLLALAERVASRWRGVFPHDKIEVKVHDDDQ